MVLFDEFSPATIPERGGAFRRAHDVGEENRCEHAVERRFFLANLCEKASDLINDRVAPGIPVEVRATLA